MAFTAIRHRLPFLALLATVAAGSPDFTIRIGSIGPFDPLTPALETSESQLAGSLVYEPLLTPDDTGALSPRLARDWRPLPNGSIYVEPDSNRHFSDGSPVTREEIIESLVAAGLTPAPMGSGLEVAPGPSRVHPAAALPRATIFKRSPTGYLGSGAFTIVSQARDLIVLQRLSHVPHRIDRVELVGYPNTRDLFRALHHGDCNGALTFDPELAEYFLGFPHLQLIETPPFHRRAIIFNRNVLSAEEQRVLLAHLAASHLPSLDLERHPPESIKHKPARLGPGSKIDIVSWSGDRASHTAALAVRLMLEHRGGETLALSQPELAGALRKGTVGVLIGPLQVWPEAEALSIWHTGGPLFSITGYSNTALDAALDAGDWAAARRAFDLDPPGILLSERRSLFALDSRIAKPTIGRYLPLENLPSWEVW